MAKKQNQNSGSNQGNEPEVNEEKKEMVIPKDATIDVPVTVISLEGDVHHENGVEFQVGKKTAEKLAKLGRVKIKESE